MKTTTERAIEEVVAEYGEIKKEYTLEEALELADWLYTTGVIPFRMKSEFALSEQLDSLWFSFENEHGADGVPVERPDAPEVFKSIDEIVNFIESSYEKMEKELEKVKYINQENL